MHLPKLQFTLCKIYLLPVRRAELANLLSLLQPSLILLGNLNDKRLLWGGNITDDRGILAYDICADLDLSLLNLGALMRLCVWS
jgi:hypothetical protein